MSRKLILTLALVFAMGHSAHADDLRLDTPYARDEAKSKAQTLKTHGKVWMVIGAIHFAAAAAAGIAFAVETASCTGTCRNGDFVSPIVMGAMAGGGLISTTVGIPLYVEGAKLERRVWVQPQPTGFALRF